MIEREIETHLKNGIDMPMEYWEWRASNRRKFNNTKAIIVSIKKQFNKSF